MDRFINYWNGQLAGKAELCTVEFVPDLEQTAGPLSWHLSKADIANLKKSWGGGDKPETWNKNIKANWDKLANFLNQGSVKECAPQPAQNNPA